MKDTVFFKQGELGLRVLPIIQEEAVFVLKGGTRLEDYGQSRRPSRPEVKWKGASGGVDLPAEMESPLRGGGLDFPGILIANCSGTFRHLLGTCLEHGFDFTKCLI